MPSSSDVGAQSFVDLRAHGPRLGAPAEGGQRRCGAAPAAGPLSDHEVDPAQRSAENIDVFDVELSTAELAAIDALDTGQRGCPEPESITLENYGHRI